MKAVTEELARDFPETPRSLAQAREFWLKHQGAETGMEQMDHPASSSSKPFSIVVQGFLEFLIRDEAIPILVDIIEVRFQQRKLSGFVL